MSRNTEIFQIYQSADEINNASIDAFLERFGNQHPVFIDCNDSTSKKGIFTFGLRNRLNNRGVSYSITNLKSSEELFAKAFSRTQPNIVVLNTGRSPELSVAMAKLKGLVASNPGIVVSLFGYTEWLMYTRNNLDNFFTFNTHILLQPRFGKNTKSGEWLSSLVWIGNAICHAKVCVDGLRPCAILYTWCA